MALYLLALACGIASTRGGDGYLGFLLAVGTVLGATVYAYWRVLWLLAQGRRSGNVLWVLSLLLLVAWSGWVAWSLVMTREGPGSLGVGAVVCLTPVACWAYALSRIR